VRLLVALPVRHRAARAIPVARYRAQLVRALLPEQRRQQP
jgi:hypothetical protein